MVNFIFFVAIYIFFFFVLVFFYFCFFFYDSLIVRSLLLNYWQDVGIERNVESKTRFHNLQEWNPRCRIYSIFQWHCYDFFFLFFWFSFLLRLFSHHSDEIVQTEIKFESSVATVIKLQMEADPLDKYVWQPGWWKRFYLSFFLFFVFIRNRMECSNFCFLPLDVCSCGYDWGRGGEISPDFLHVLFVH
jgi:hypothetical protein